MIVYGGYKSNHIDELHQYHFVLADTSREAKSIGKQEMKHFTDMDHIDEVVNVFDNANMTCGFQIDNCKFTDNGYNHTFIKLK
jgi:hypothetical protein